jgi:hypothetical protein
MKKIKRQAKFPKEFRITPPVLSSDTWASFEELLKTLNEPVNKPPEKTVRSDKEQIQLFRDIAIGLWRTKMKMVTYGTDEPQPEMKRVYRHLQSVWDSLNEAGIEIQDHTGINFDSGLAISVIAFQPTDNLDQEKVIETIKPSVYYRGTQIQMGEVIVGTPRNS